MERKSKEEILSDITDTDEGIISTYDYSIYEAMQAYADQEMVLFAEWLANSPFVFKDGLWYEITGELIGKEHPVYSEKGYTTQQLLTIYKKEQDDK